MSRNRDRVLKAIAECQGVFTPTDISLKAETSPATAYVIIKELQNSGVVAVSKKDGKRMLYALTNANALAPSQATGMSLKPSKAEKYIMSLPVVDRFRYTQDLVDMVVANISPSMLLTGMSGVGKTHMVLERLEQAEMKKNRDFFVVTSHSSPMGLYRFLYEHRDGILIFDDCDSVFRDEISTNILKSALDSYATRTVCWRSERMPEDLEPEFNFEGSIIFISNLDATSVDAAVKSRTITVNLRLSPSELIVYMRSILPKIPPHKADLKIKEEVLDFLETVKDHFSSFNLRTFINVCRLRMAEDTMRKMGKKVIKGEWQKKALCLEN